MAITRYAGDRFTIAAGDAKPTGVLDGAVLVDTGNLELYVKRNGSWEEIAGGGGGSTNPSAPLNSVQFNNGGSFGGDADLTFTNGNQLNVNKLSIAGNVIDSNVSVGENGMVLTNEGATGVNWKNIESVLSGVGGSGVANYVARWSDEDTLTSGVIQDNGTSVGIRQAPDASNTLSIKSVANNENVLQVAADDGDGLFNIRQSANDCLIRGYKDGNVQNIQIHSDGVSYLKGGSVGIGVTNPSFKLEVMDSTTTVGSPTFGYQGATINLRQSSDTDGNTAGYVFEGAVGAAYMGGMYCEFKDHSAYKTKLHWATRNGGAFGSKMTMDEDGNVGIGTTSPTKKLDVRSEARVWNGTNGIELSYSTGNTSGIVASANTSGNLEFRPNIGASAAMFILNNRNVGIGTDDPDTKLTVYHTSGNVVMFKGQGGSNTHRFGATGVTNIYGQTGSVLFNITNSGVGDYMDVGSGAFYVKKDGNVGIGTDAPSGVSKVDILRPARTTAFNAGDGDTWHDLLIRNPTNSVNAAAGIAFVMNGSYHKNAGAGIAAIAGGVGTDYDASLVFITRPTADYAAERMRILYDGNVGIGTTNPGKDLEVYNASEPRIRVTAGANSNPGYEWAEGGTRKWVIYNDNTNDNLEFKTDSDVRMVIKQDGKVGIGTISPDTKLEISSGEMGSTAEFVGLKVTHSDHDASVASEASMRLAYTHSGGEAYSYIKLIESATNSFDGHLTIGTPKNNNSGGSTTNEWVRIKNDGKVGINTNSPMKRLDVRWSSSDTTVATGNGLSGGSAGEGMLLLNTYNGAGVYANLDFRAYDADARIAVERTASGNQSNMHFITDNSSNFATRMFIQYDGNVGIGTTAPDSPLHVKAAATNAYVQEWDNSSGNLIAGVYSNGVDGVFQVGSSLGGTQVNLNSNGDSYFRGGAVGIGTVTPATPLHVYSTANDVLKIQGGDHVRVLIDGTDSSEKSLNFSEAGSLMWKLGMENIAPFEAFVIKNNDNGAPQFVIDYNSGNVGIGTTSPNALLHVKGAVNERAYIKIEGSGTTADAAIQFSLDDEAATWTAGIDDTENRFSIAEGTQLGTSDRLIILPGGNVGIGDNLVAPEHRLHVSGDAIISGVLYDSINSSGASGYVLTSEVGGPQWQMIEDVLSGVGGNGTANYVPKWEDSDTIGNSIIYDDGDVGIGTDNPGYKLDVSGDGRFVSPIPLSLERPTYEPVHFGFTSDGSDHHMYLKATSAAATYQLTQLRFGVSTADTLIITDNGRVGIGSDGPEVKLDVYGSLNLRSEYNLTWGGTAGADIPLIYGKSGSSGYLAFHSQGTDGESMRIDADNKVGIGITDPAYTLDVKSSAVATTGGIQLRASGDENRLVRIYEGTTGDGVIDICKNDIGTTVLLQADGVSYFTGGSVGIGTASPAVPLEMYHATLSELQVVALSGNDSALNLIERDATGNTNNTKFGEANTWGFQWKYDGGENKLFLSSGNQGTVSNRITVKRDDGRVGIGTDAPGEKLDVNGKIQIRGGNWLVLRNSDNSNYGSMRGASDTSNDVTINTNGEVIRFKQNGNVGIGTTDPAQLLSVEGSKSGAWITKLKNTHSTNGNGLLVQAADNNDVKVVEFRNLAETSTFTMMGDGKVGVGSDDPRCILNVSKAYTTGYGVEDCYLMLGGQEAQANSTRLIGFGYIHGTSTHPPANIGFLQNSNDGFTNGDLIFRTRETTTNVSPTERMRILSDGNVGIGTTAPESLLHLHGSVPTIILHDTRTSVAGHDYGRIQWHTKDTSMPGTDDIGAEIRAYDDSDTYGDRAALIFSTAHNATSLTERMRIGSDGNVGIGDNLIAPAHRLHVSGDAIISGYLYDSTNSTGTDGYVFTTKENGPRWEAIEDVLSGVGGNGTAEYIPRWVDSDTLGNSIIHDDGTHVGVGTNAGEAYLMVEYSNNNTGTWWTDSSAGLNVYNTNTTAGAGPTMKLRGADARIVYGENGSSDKLTFSSRQSQDTAGEAITFDNNGKVGIGSATPAYKLEVRGDYIFVDSGKGIRFGGSSHQVSRESSTNELRIKSANTTGFITFLTGGGSEYMRIAADGKVGIGTTNPMQTLHSVASVGTRAARFDGVSGWYTTKVFGYNQLNNSYGTIIQAGTSSTDTAFAVVNAPGTSEYFRVKGDGKVGIGTTNPGQRLDVINGAIRVSSSGETKIFFRETIAADTYADRWTIGNDDAINNAFVFSTGATFAAPKLAIADTGAITFNNTYTFPTADGTEGYHLQTDGAGAVTWEAGGGTVTGSGLDNFIPQWNGTTALEDSLIYSHAYGVVINSTFLTSYATNRQVFEVKGTAGAGAFDGGITNLTASSNTNAARVGQLAFINSANANHVNPNAAAGSRIAQIISTVVTTDSNAGDDSGGDLQFWTKAEAGLPAERMRILSDGKVGIGTTNPLAKLHLENDAEATALFIKGTTATNEASHILFENTQGAKKFAIGGGGSGVTNNGLGFRNVTDNTLPMIIDDAGKVGIGITNPAGQLQVKGGQTVFDDSTDAGAPSITFEGDLDTGFLREGANIIGVTTGGVRRWSIGNGSITSQITGGARIVQTNGTAAVPAFTFNDDADTGMYRGGANTLSFSTAGTHQLSIIGDGKVGIGTPTPYYALDVRYTNNDTSFSGGSSGNWGGSGLRLENASTTAGAMALIQFRTSIAEWFIGNKFISGNTSDFIFVHEDSEKVRFKTDGKVGIGTTAPSSLLHIYENTSAEGNTQLHIHNDKTDDAAVLLLEGKRTSYTDTAQVLFANNGTNVAQIRAYSGGTDGALGFFTKTSSGSLDEKLTISDAGTASFNGYIKVAGLDLGVGWGDLNTGIFGRGTANSSSYLQFRVNGGTAAIHIDSNKNVGLGVTPESWQSSYKALQITSGGYIAGRTSDVTQLFLGANAYYDSVNTRWEYIGSGEATRYYTSEGAHYFQTAASGSADGAITWSTPLSISSTGGATFGGYGSGTHTGTAAYKLSVDSSGNLIETSIGAGAIDGSGTTNYISKWTDSDTIGNSNILDNGTNVGISTNNPVGLLDIIRVSNTAPALRIGSSATYGWGFFSRASTGDLSIERDNNTTYSPTLYLKRADGNVGIGTTNPGGKLEVDGSSVTVPLLVKAGTGATSIKFVGRSTDHISSLDFFQNNGSSGGGFFQSNGTWMRARADGGVHFRNGDTPVTTSSDFTINGMSLGIGVNSTSYKLTVNDTTASDNKTIAHFEGQGIGGSTDDGGQYISVTRTGPISQANGVMGGIIFGRSVPTGSCCTIRSNYKYTAGRDLEFLTSADNSADPVIRMKIKGDGNVGIGPDNPGAKLEVRGGSATIPNLGTYGSLFNLRRADGHIGLSIDIDSATNNFWLQAQNSTSPIAQAILLNPKGGNVGIGTTNPGSYKLYVNGTSYIDDTLTVDGNINFDTIGQYLTFYGGGNLEHSISSRNSSGTAADDIRLNTFGALFINLDSNNNNTSGADFSIGRHGQTGAITDWLLDLSGETGKLTLNKYGSGTHTGTAAYKLSVDASGNLIETSIGAGAIDGNGTAGKMTKWSDTDTVTDSSFLSESGSQLTNTASIVDCTTANFQLRLSNYGRIGVGTNNATSPFISYLGDNSTWSGDSALIRAYNAGNRGTKGHAYGSNLLRLDFSDACAMIVNKDGKVGIGTTDPDSALHVYDIGSGEVRFQRVTGYTGLMRFGFPSGTASIRTDGNFQIKASDAWGADLYIKSDGNVGIGIDTPTSLLHVAGDLGNGNFLSHINNTGTQSEDNGLNVQIASSGSSALGLKVQTGGAANAFIVAGDGNTGVGLTASAMVQKFNVNGNAYIDGSVGIGTTAPGAKLDVYRNGGFTNDVPTARIYHRNNPDGGQTNVAALDVNVGMSNADLYHHGYVSLYNHFTGGAYNSPILYLSSNSWTGTNHRQWWGLQALADTTATGDRLAFTCDLSSANPTATPVHIMSLQTDGNVGIGVNAPAAKLDVDLDGGTTYARLGYDNYASFQFYRNLTASSTSLPVMMVRQTHPDDDQTALVVDQDGSGYILELIEDTTTRLVVQADGNVGIGTTDPGTLLEVSGIATAGTFRATGKLVSADNIFMDAGQFYLGAENGNTNDTYRMYHSSGSFLLQSRESGTWTPRFTIATAGAITFNNAFTFPTADGTANQMLKTNGSGTLTWTSAGTGTVTGTGTANYVSKWTGTNSQGNSSIFDNGTSVGINQTSPQATNRLEVNGQTRIVGGLIVGNSGLGQGVAPRQLFVKGGGTQGIRIEDSTSSNYVYDITCDFTNGFRITDVTSSKDAFTIEKTTGYVGIGTTNPDALLDVRGTVKVGVDDAGHDVMLYGATSGRYWEWDQSMDLVRMRDGVKSVYGNGDDLQFYHDGSNSYIKNQIGWLNMPLSQNGLSIANADFSELIATFRLNGSCDLYYDGSKKLETTSTGVDITGSATMSGLTVNGGNILAVGANDTAAVTGMIVRTSGSSSQGFFGVEGSGTGYLAGSISRATLLASTASGTALQLGSAGTVRATIAVDGNVGIGVTAPTDPLQVVRTTASQVQRVLALSNFGTTDGTGTRLTFSGYSSTSAEKTQATIVARTIDSDNSAYTSDLRFSTRTTDALVIATDGNVGIGTTAPDNALHVYSTTDNASAVLIDGSASNSGFISFRQSGVEKSYIQYTSNSYLRYFAAGGHSFAQSIGIGTTNPGEKLQISGTEAVIKLVDTAATSAGYVDFDGTALQLNTNRNPNTGAFSDTGKSHASIILSGAAGGSSILFYTKDSNNATGTQRAIIEADGTLDLKSAKFKINGSGGTAGYHLQTDGSGNISWQPGTAGFVDGSGTATYIPKWTDGDTIGNSIIVDTGSKVGIGMTNPYYKFDVKGSDNNQRLGIQPNQHKPGRMHLAYNSYLSGNTFWYGLYAGSMGMITFYEEDAYENNVGGMGFLINRIASDNTSIGADPDPQMLITTGGSVGIGTTAPGAYKLNVQGNVYISGTLTEASSLGIKENVETYTPSLEIINKLRPVRYNKKKSKKKEVGLVAEELAEMFPELVERDEKGNPSGVNYSRAVAVLLHGFKELYKEVKELKEKI